MSEQVKHNQVKYLKNAELDLRIKNLARQERELLAEVLKTIAEIDARKLYVELGFSNLYSYLVEGVGYSAASAQRRIDGARLMREAPEIEPKIQTGAVNLSQVSLIQKASREVLRTQGQKVSVVDKVELLEQLANKNHQDSQKQVAQYFDLPVETQYRQKVQADDSVRLEITLSRELYEKLQRAQGLVSHAVPSNNLAQFLDYVADKIIRQKTKQKTTAKFTSDREVVPRKTEEKSKAKSTSDGEVTPRMTGQKSGANSTSDAELTPINIEGLAHRDLQINENGLKGKSSSLNPRQNESLSLHENLSKNINKKIHENLSSMKNLSLRDSLNLSLRENLSKRPNNNQNLKQSQIPSPSPSPNKNLNHKFTSQTKKLKLGEHKRCQYVDSKTRRSCESHWFLQVDHIKSRWAGGHGGLNNAQVLCAAHNKLKYQKESNLKLT